MTSLLKTDVDSLLLTEPRLYIIGRSDIYDMNTGKFGAQTAHAGGAFAKTARASNNKAVIADLELWEGTRGFGTTITLIATEQEIRDTVSKMHGYGLISDVVIDDSYPFKNFYGTMFTAEELTCGYVFAPMTINKEALDHLRTFPLHP